MTAVDRRERERSSMFRGPRVARLRRVVFDPATTKGPAGPFNRSKHNQPTEGGRSVKVSRRVTTACGPAGSTCPFWARRMNRQRILGRVRGASSRGRSPSSGSEACMSAMTFALGFSHDDLVDLGRDSTAGDEHRVDRDLRTLVLEDEAKGKRVRAKAWQRELRQREDLRPWTKERGPPWRGRIGRTPPCPSRAASRFPPSRPTGRRSRVVSSS